VEDMLWFFIAGLTGRNSVNTKKTFNFHVLLRRDPFFNFWGVFSTFGAFRVLTVFSYFYRIFQLFTVFYRFWSFLDRFFQLLASFFNFLPVFSCSSSMATRNPGVKLRASRGVG
jgi:hypothetical protein